MIHSIDKSVPFASDMTFRRKFVGIFILSVILISFFTVKRDFNDYKTLLQMLEEIKESNYQFKETVIELKSLIDNLRDNCSLWDPELPVIYAVTPTYARPVQKAELTRMSHTLRLVRNFHWIVVEDAEKPSSLVGDLLKCSFLNYTHLAASTPAPLKRKLKEPKWKKPRGVSQRNAAIRWLRQNKNRDTDRGVVYFADDDNAYGLNVFNEMRGISKVGVWPVGLVGGLMVEKPLIDSATGRVVGWNSHWRPEREFAIDMAGFAVNLQHLLANPSAEFSFNVERGFQESALLSQLVKIEELEPRADNCTKVYVWHTRTEEPYLGDEKVLRSKGQRSDENIEV